MKIIVRCNCKKELRVTDSYVNSQGDIVIDVDTCEKCAGKIPDTYGQCSKCEDLAPLKACMDLISRLYKRIKNHHNLSESIKIIMKELYEKANSIGKK